MSNTIGTAQVITFSTTRDDEIFLYPLRALTKGVTTGHISLLLEFTDTELYNKYIANYPRIPHRELIDPITQKPKYQVYVSFGPEQELWQPFSSGGVLRDYMGDCISSGACFPMNYDPKFLAINHPNTLDNVKEARSVSEAEIVELLDPIKLEKKEILRLKNLIEKSLQKAPLTIEPQKKIFAPRIPIGRTFLKSEQSIGPNIVLHETYFACKYSAASVAAAKKYMQEYDDWRIVCNRLNSVQILLGSQHDLTKRFSAVEKMYKLRAKMSKYNLKSHMLQEYPGLSQDQLDAEMEKYFTHGCPERDAVTLPIIAKSASDNLPGLALEPMLQYVNAVATHPKQFPYSVFGINCAYIVYNTLWEGVKNSPPNMLKKHLALAWYITCLRLTNTPSMVIQNAARAEAAAQQNELDTNTSNATPGIYGLAMRAKDFAYTRILQFSASDTGTEDDDSISDAELTTRVGRMARMLQSLNSYVKL